MTVRFARSLPSFLRLWPLLLVLGVGSARAGDVDAAPIFEHETTSDYSIYRALGPFIEIVYTADGKQLIAVRPFFSRFKDPNKDYFARDILWPLVTYRILNDELMDKGVLSEYADADVHDPTSKRHRFIYPFYFRGQSAEGEKFLAILPFWGNTKDAFGYEYMKFRMFPIYMQTSRMGITSTHWAFPFYVKAEGPKIYRHRLWPIYGVSRKKGVWEQKFALWPIFHWGKPLDDTKEGSALFIFPLYGRMTYKDPTRRDPVLLEGRAFLWPFFSGLRTKEGYRLNMPWPFFQWAKNMDGPNTGWLYVWPFYGHRKRQLWEEWWYLWPVVWRFVDQKHGGVVGKRFYIAPIYWQNIQRDAEGGRVETYRRVYPLASYTDRPQDPYRQIRILDLWPMRRAYPVERNWAPIWTLYTYTRTPTSKRHELLWGTYQLRRREGQLEKHTLFPLFSYKRGEDGTSKRLDFLTGLIGRETDADGSRHLRLFWGLNRRGKKTAEAAGDAPVLAPAAAAAPRYPTPRETRDLWIPTDQLDQP